MGQQGVTWGNKGLQGVTRGYRGLYEVTRGYRGLHGVNLSVFIIRLNIVYDLS